MARGLLAALSLLVLFGCKGPGCQGDKAGKRADPLGAGRSGPAPPRSRVNRLATVKLWAYQIAGLTAAGAVDALAASRYDLLVLEPTRTEKPHSTFDGKGMVQRLRVTRGRSGVERLVLAHVNIGQAEARRYYWQGDWVAPTDNAPGSPDFLVYKDPDGWAESYPVAYWDPRWKKLLIQDADSVLNRVIDDGYDGIYMDWVEGFLNTDVKQRAASDGVDAAVEMITLIAEIRRHARASRPGFLIVAQNAAELAQGHPEYLKQIDAVAQEQIFFDGKADTDWNDPDVCDVRIPSSGPYGRQFYVGLLKPYQAAKLPVLNVEYACDPANVKEAYALSAKEGYVTYVSRRPLDRLTSSPPPGY